MANFNTVSINSFLKEREDRFKPEEANKLALKRLEKIDFSGNIHIVEDKETRTGMILVKKGDLVISGINVEKGAISVYNGQDDVLATIHYSSYSFDKSKIDVDYFKWFLRSKTFKDIVNSSIKGGIKTELKPKKFLPLIIPLPDLNTQIEIRKKLDSVDNEIKELVDIDFKNEDYIQKLRQSILQEAVSGKLVPQDSKDEPASELLKKIEAEKEKLIKEGKIKKDKPLPPISKDEIPYELPKGWEWVKLGEVYSILRGSSPRPKGDKRFFSEKPTNFNWITISDITNFCNDSILLKTKEFLTSEGSQRSTFVNKDEVIIAVSGSTTGKSCITGINGYIYDGLAVFKKITTIINNQYFYIFIKQLYDSLNKSKEGSAFPNINTEKLKNIIFSLPPLPEQIRIVQKVNQLMKLCDELETKVKENQKNSELLMEAVLREAFET